MTLRQLEAENAQLKSLLMLRRMGWCSQRERERLERENEELRKALAEGR